MASTHSLAQPGRNYLPAAGHHLALPLYDPLVKLIGADKARPVLLGQADVSRYHRLLDIGCGTGTFTAHIKRTYPDTKVFGLDPDPNALARARQKAERAHASIHFDHGFADELPYPDSLFDRVFSCFMFHHLNSGERLKMLQEVRRVLVPGGSFHLMDFIPPNGFIGRKMAASERLKDNSEERMIELMQQAGFIHSKKLAERSLLLGIFRVAYYRADFPEWLPALARS